MCRSCSRIDKLERKIAFMEGKESCEPFMNAQAAKIAKLEDVIIGLQADLKICRKMDGELFIDEDDIARNRRRRKCDCENGETGSND